jgi:hypothetical protein
MFDKNFTKIAGRGSSLSYKSLTLVAWLLAASALAQAQAFYGLAPSDDGSALAFSGGGLRGPDGSLASVFFMKRGGPILSLGAAGTSIGISANGIRVASLKVETRLGRKPNCSGGSSCITAITDIRGQVVDLTRTGEPPTPVWSYGSNGPGGLGFLRIQMQSSGRKMMLDFGNSVRIDIAVWNQNLSRRRARFRLRPTRLGISHDWQ